MQQYNKPSYWRSVLAPILGNFWYNIFKDNWLITAIQKVFSYVIGSSVLKYIQEIKKQSSFKYTPSFQPFFPVPIIIPIKSITNSQQLTSKQIDLLGWLDALTKNTTSSQIPFYTSSLLYTIKYDIEQPLYIRTSFYNDADRLKIGQDFQIVNGKLRFKNQKVLEKAQRKEVLVQGQLLQCYKLWVQIPQHAYCLDTLSFLLQLPKNWAWKYKGSLYKAWKIKQCGLTEKNLLQFLSCFIDNKKINIFQSQSEISDQDIKALPVWSDIGMLFALNTSMSVDENKHLPLVKDVTQTSAPEAYINIVQKLRANSNNVCLLSINEKTINPMSWLRSRIYKQTLLLIKLRASITQDLYKAFVFVISNLPLGTQLYVYDAESNILPCISNFKPSQNQLNRYKCSFQPLYIKQDYDTVAK